MSHSREEIDSTDHKLNEWDLLNSTKINDDETNLRWAYLGEIWCNQYRKTRK